MQLPPDNGHGAVAFAGHGDPCRSGLSRLQNRHAAAGRARPAQFAWGADDIPCICDLPDDQVDDGVWSDGPLRNYLGHRASVLGMVNSRVDEVLPFLIEQATALDLVVFDWATETIHRPDPGRAR